jgi:hypothetical protein
MTYWVRGAGLFHLCQDHWRETSIEGRDELWRLLGIPPHDP